MRVLCGQMRLNIGNEQTSTTYWNMVMDGWMDGWMEDRCASKSKFFRDILGKAGSRGNSKKNIQKIHCRSLFFRKTRIKDLMENSHILS